jgi:hypothetical protein
MLSVSQSHAINEVTPLQSQRFVIGKVASLSLNACLEITPDVTLGYIQNKEVLFSQPQWETKFINYFSLK